MGASWTRSSRRSGCSAFAEQELARAVRRFGGSYELSAPTRFLEGGGPAVQAVVPARGSRLERELGLRRAAFTCASVSVSQASTSSESKRVTLGSGSCTPPATTVSVAPGRHARPLPLVNVVASHRLHVRACIAL